VASSLGLEMKNRPAGADPVATEDGEPARASQGADVPLFIGLPFSRCCG